MGQDFKELTVELTFISSSASCSTDFHQHLSHSTLSAASWVRSNVFFFFLSPHLVCCCCFMARDCFYGNILDSKQSNFPKDHQG